MSTVVSTIGGEAFTFTYFLTPPAESTTFTDDVGITSSSDDVPPASILPTSSLTTYTFFTTVTFDGTPVVTSNEHINTDLIFTSVPDHVIPSASPSLVFDTPSLVYETIEKTLIKTEYNTLTFFATLFKGDEQIVTPIKETQSSLVTATETYTITKTASPQIFATSAVPASIQPSILPSNVVYTTRIVLNTVTNVITFFQGDSTIVTSLQDIITNVVTEPVTYIPATPTLDAPSESLSFETTIEPIINTRTIFNTQTHFVTLFSGTDTITSSITEVNSNVITETVDYTTRTFVSPPTSSVHPSDGVESATEVFTYTPPAITATIDGKVIPAGIAETSPQVVAPSSPVVLDTSSTRDDEGQIDTIVSTYTYFMTLVDGDSTIVTSSEELSTHYIRKTTPPVIDSAPTSQLIEEILVTRTQLSTNTFTFTLFNGSTSTVITSEQVESDVITDTIRSIVSLPTTNSPIVSSMPVAVPDSARVLTLFTTYTYYTTTVSDTRTLLTSSEEVITKYITIDHPAASSSSRPLVTTKQPSLPPTSSGVIDETTGKVPVTTVIDGSKIVFFTESPIRESSLISMPSISVRPTTTIIGGSTVIFYNTADASSGEDATEQPIASEDSFAIPFSPTFSDVTPEYSTTVTPVLKPFTSVINGATIIVFKEVIEEPEPSTYVEETSTVIAPLPSSTLTLESTPVPSETEVSSPQPPSELPVSFIVESTDETVSPDVSPSVKILTGSSVIFFMPTTEEPEVTTVEEEATELTSATTTLLESSVDISTENVNSGSETPELNISSTTSLTVPNIVTSVLESATTFVGSNGKTTSAAASATLIFITGTDGNVLTLMPATLATSEVRPTETTLEQTTDEAVSVSIPAVTKEDDMDPAIKEVIDMVMDKSTSEISPVEVAQSTDDTTVTESSTLTTTTTEKVIRPIFLQPDLIPFFPSKSEMIDEPVAMLDSTVTESTVKTEIITGATTLFIDPPVRPTIPNTDTSSTSSISVTDETPSLAGSTETILSGASTVFGGFLFTKPTTDFTTTTTEDAVRPAYTRPAYTRPVFDPFPSSSSSEVPYHSEESYLSTKYITRTESVTRTLTLSTTSIYYTRGSPLTVTQFYTTTIAPRTIVSTIVGDRTILGTAPRAPATNSIAPDSASGYNATPVTTTVTTTTLIFNSITTTVVRTLVIPTIDPTKIDLSEATEINDIFSVPRGPEGRSNNFGRNDADHLPNDISTSISSQVKPPLRPAYGGAERPDAGVTKFPKENSDFNEIENQSMCVPGCDYINHEICKKINGLWRCECRPGYARTDKFRTCEGDFFFCLLLLLSLKAICLSFQFYN